MNNLDKQYTDLLQDILDNGVQKTDRTGTGTLSVFGRQIRHKMSDGFPLLTTKKMPFKTMVTELVWFLRGDTNIKYLVDNNCHIWDGDAYKNYKKYYTKKYNGTDGLRINQYPLSDSTIENIILSQEEFINKIKTDDEFAKKWGELGPIYGKQWRKWNSITKKWWNDPEYQGYGSDSRSGWEYDETQIDQIQNLINDLKINPDSRRLMVNAWNVGELDQMVLPPCHYGFQVYTRELTFEERCKIQIDKLDGMYSSEKDLFIHHSINAVKQIKMDENNIPQRAISLMCNQRSVDTFLGLPFNIASYGLLLMMIADEVNMVPDELIGNLGDTHLYLNHIEQAKEQIGRELTLEERRNLVSPEMFSQIYTAGDSSTLSHSEIDLWCIPRRTREPFELPTVHVRDGIFSFMPDDVILENYKSHPAIKAPLSN
jgi:thymidylate synthase